jgi:hypothetical protein
MDRDFDWLIKIKNERDRADIQRLIRRWYNFNSDFAKECGIDKACLSRFLRGERPISGESLEKMYGVLASKLDPCTLDYPSEFEVFLKYIPLGALGIPTSTEGYSTPVFQYTAMNDGVQEII